MQYYLEAAIVEVIERAKRLKIGFPTPPPLHFQALAQRCLDLIDENISDLKLLHTAPEFQNEANQSTRLKLLKIRIREIDLIENIAVSAITRCIDGDERINKFVQGICREIDYPLIPPTVSGLSSDYYQIYPKFNLLCVPLLECDFMLHLPDLYHELAHPLFWAEHDDRLKPFQEEAKTFYDIVSAHFDRVILEDQRIHQGGSSHAYEAWKTNWFRWRIEFFCDIFGICTAGPAYGWAHLHLSMKRGGNPFEIPVHAKSTHPNDEARMQVILHVLDLMKLNDHKRAIAERWETLQQIHKREKDQVYKLAYPLEILEQCAIHGFRAVVGINCTIAPHQQGTIFKTLNEAWDLFWSDYNSFFEWEEKKMTELQRMFTR
ncbi:MAG: hypothetical protein DYG98_08570 [Haliscomenobacteraceae bacterium CHB4]|nr:hypothetical protein [Haliscomenobacteraceae bacterium CHB4]